MSLKITTPLDFEFTPTPSETPPASHAIMYFKADGKLYKKIGSVETLIEVDPGASFSDVWAINTITNC